MIIYPAIILALLLVGFFIVWRRAYLEQDGLPQSTASFNQASKKNNQDPIREPVASNPDSEYVFEEAEVTPSSFEEDNFAKAEELFKKKQYISAEKWYFEAVKKNPKNPKIFSRLGVIYLEQNNFKDAIEALREAIKLETDSASAYFNLSYALNIEGDKREAVDNARKALRIDPKNEKYKKWLEHLKSRPF